MLKKHLRRPSPSMAVAVVALLFALTGSAVASGPIASITKLLGLNSKQKGQVTSIANTQIGKKAPGLHVSYAATPFQLSSNQYEWKVYMDNRGSSDETFTVYAVCAPGTASGLVAP